MALADKRQASGVLTRSTSGSLRQRQKARPYPEYLEERNPGRVSMKDRARLGKEERPREMQTKVKPQRAMEMGETEVTREA